MSEAGKLRAVHLGREAWIYVRQSTMTQVRENAESLARQYELAERAASLGWSAGQIRVVDEDLGRSGADATARSGFQSLVAAVGLGKVGLVLGLEVSRLARRNSDWYHLLDLCALTDTLIGDGDGLYHPGDYNDRLVLGLKGTMSEAELHLLRSRLNAGLFHKARRGELRKGLPVGFEYDEDDRVVQNPDEAVRSAIAEVFARFATLGSARQVVVSMRADGIRLPRRTGGSRQIRWEMATYPAVHDLLTNPAYSGAFVFGRTKTRRSVSEDGQVLTRTVDIPVDDWEICIPDHHRGYITWDTYLANRKKLRDNWRPPAGQGGGAAREGTALLQGLVRCGRCGRTMQVSYTNRHHVRYLCGRAMYMYGGTSGCQSIAGRRFEAAVLDEVFAVLEPVALSATMTALSQAEAAHQQRIRVFELAVERACFEKDRARRQFDACEPENRLVARTLEARFEQCLVALRQAEADLAVQRSRRPLRLSEEEMAWLNRAGIDVRAVFEATTTNTRERKQLLRALIANVTITVHRPRGIATGHIAWEGGAVTPIEVSLPRRGTNGWSLDEAAVEMIRRLAPDHEDAVVAEKLNRAGHATATGLAFRHHHVRHIRLTRGIAHHQARAVDEDTELVSMTEAQQLLGVSRATLNRWLAEGFITGRQDEAGRWRLRVDEDVRVRIVCELPEGWQKLATAAETLGVARQTVLDRVRRGELEAVQVQQGKRRGLAIRVPDADIGLFSLATNG
ncbi:MAG: recombinase family protein [Acidimicrobiales bacterium]|jgi:DNA invertase Pin-like site-specific DNA recombinase/transposase